MKTIEEMSYAAARQIYEEIGLSKHSLERVSEIIAERITEQKTIDDAELAEVKRQRDEYYDELLKLRQQKAIAIDKACEWIKSNLDKDEGGEIEYCFRKAMEAE